MTLDEVAATVRLAAERVFARRALDRPVATELRRPREVRHGDLVSTVVLRSEMPAADRVAVAAEVARELAGGPGVSSAWADGPGFLGLRLDDRSIAASVRELVLSGSPPAPPVPVEPPAWLIEVAGRPAARYAWAGPDQPGWAGAGRWTRANDENPYYVVQYAGVTAANNRRWAADLGVVRGDSLPTEGRDLQIDLATFPWSDPAPDAVTRALARSAAGYLRFVGARRVLPLGDEPISDDHRSLLWLTQATRVVVAAGLNRLGIAAADRL